MELSILEYYKLSYINSLRDYFGRFCLRAVRENVPPAG